MQLNPMDATLVQVAVNVAADLQLRAGDAIYVAAARKMNIPLVSWDKEQLAKGEYQLTGLYTERIHIPRGNPRRIDYA